MQELARGWKDDPRRFPLLQGTRPQTMKTSYAVRGGAGAGARLEGRSRDASHLKERVRNDDIRVRCAAVQELARGWKDDPDTLPMLRDRAETMKTMLSGRRRLQELARGWKDDPDTLPILKDRARNDENEDVREAAVEELARGWKDDPETLPF